MSGRPTTTMGIDRRGRRLSVRHGVAVHRDTTFECGMLQKLTTDGPVDVVEEWAAGTEHYRVREQQDLIEQPGSEELGGQGRATDADVAIGGSADASKLVDGIHTTDHTGVEACIGSGAGNQHLWGVDSDPPVLLDVPGHRLVVRDLWPGPLHDLIDHPSFHEAARSSSTPRSSPVITARLMMRSFSVPAGGDSERRFCSKSGTSVPSKASIR